MIPGKRADCLQPRKDRRALPDLNSRGSVTGARLLKERVLCHALPGARAGACPEVDPEVDSGLGVYPSLQTTQNKTKLHFGADLCTHALCVCVHTCVCTRVYICICTCAQVYWRAEWRRWEGGREVGGISGLGLKHS